MAAQLCAAIAAQTQQHSPPDAQPWRPDPVADSWLQILLTALTGFEIVVTSVRARLTTRRRAPVPVHPAAA